MSNKRDYYVVLSISKNATKSEIKSAFRKLAMKYHPDHNKYINTEEDFKEIREAYEVLVDDEKRKKYDQYGHQDLNQGTVQGNGTTSASARFNDFDEDFYDYNKMSIFSKIYYFLYFLLDIIKPLISLILFGLATFFIFKFHIIPHIFNFILYIFEDLWRWMKGIF